MISIRSMLRPLMVPRHVSITRSFITMPTRLNQRIPTFGSISNTNTTTQDTTDTITTRPQQQQKKKIREEIIKYIIHCKFTKNNTLMTLTAVVEDLNFEQNNSGLSFNDKVLYYLNLPEKTLVTVSTGSVGFRKWQRGEYEAASKAAARLFQIMEDKNYLGKDIELKFQDFGKGRKAFEDALLGKPGNAVRDHISRISDVTKIKFGGVRSPKPRRL